MKRTICLLLTALMTVGMLAGCRKTPEAPLVVGKNNGMLVEKARTGSASTKKLSAIDVPANYTADFMGKDISVHVDATIILPDAEQVPTATVKRDTFSQETADALIALLFGDAALYAWNGITTGRNIAIWEERIQEVEQMKAGLIPQSFDGGEKTPDEMDAYIARLRDLIAKNELANAGPAITAFQNDPSTGADEIAVQAEMDGNKAYLRIANNRFGQEESAEFFLNENMNGDFIASNTVDAGEQGRAMQAASDIFLAKLGLSNMVCNRISVGSYMAGYAVATDSVVVADSGPSAATDANDVVELQYVRQINGVPLIYTPYRGRSSEEFGTSEPWEYERITFYYQDDMLVGFVWASPYTAPEIRAENSELLPFVDIMAIFGKMILVKHVWVTNVNAERGSDAPFAMDVDRVTLSLMRVRSKHDARSGVIVPVWDFWGSAHWGEILWAEHVPLLTINAVDGSIVDRTAGF